MPSACRRRWGGNCGIASLLHPGMYQEKRPSYTPGASLFIKPKDDVRRERSTAVCFCKSVVKTTCIQHGHEASAYACPRGSSSQSTSLHITVFGWLRHGLRLSSDTFKTSHRGWRPRVDAVRFRCGQAARRPFEWLRKYG